MRLSFLSGEVGVPDRPPVRGVQSMYRRSQMRHILYRERTRADRSGHEFSLVLLRADAAGPARAVRRLARAVLRRARLTDEVGWYDGSAVWVLLPDTNAAGASRFVEDVTRLVEGKAGTPVCTVRTYPSDWPGRSTDGAEVLGEVGEVSEAGPVGGTGSARVGAGCEAPAGLSRGDLAPAVLSELTRGRRLGQPRDEGADSTAGPAGDLADVFAHPMPAWKRAMDVAGAGVGLLLFAPVMLVCATLIKLSSPGPVTFRQRRAGLNGRPFTMFKFRTMVVDAEARKVELLASGRNEQDGPAFKMKHDPRVTGVGRLLRKTSLDELPQLWNVLMGDMTLVGPRPLPMSESEACGGWHRHRVDVTPGLTCVWQVEGRSQVTFEQWARMDANYIRNRSFFTDVKILLQTIPAVLFKKGAR